MDDAPETLDALAAHAHDTSVVVIGGGIGGLVAALECAKIGMRVTVVEASDRLGGALWTAKVGGLAVDLGAEGYATRGGAVRRLVDELGLTDAVTAPDTRAEWIAGLPDGSAPLPAGTVRGIPENPWDESVRRLIGWRGTWRAYLDRLRPPLTIGQERSLGRLVRTRMGDAVLDRLVAPLSLGAFSIHPDDVDVEAVAPGLSSALTRTGSLAGGVAQLRADRRKEGEGAERFEGIDGGMSRLIDALRSRLGELGARVVLNARVSEIEPRADGRWSVVLDAGSPAGFAVESGAVQRDPLDAGGSGAGAETAGSDDPAAVPLEPADALIIATGAAETVRLVRAAVPSLEPLPVTELEVVTLVVSSRELTARPARTAVYPVPGNAVAASVTDTTARWPWVRRASGEDVHVLKVTFGGPDAPPATLSLDDAAAAELAVAAASALLEVPLDPARVRGSSRARYEQPLPVSAIGHREVVDAVRSAIHAVPGLAVVGAAVAGTGIAQVVPDAQAEAERVRRRALWPSAEPGE